MFIAAINDCGRGFVRRLSLVPGGADDLEPVRFGDGECGAQALAGSVQYSPARFSLTQHNLRQVVESFHVIPRPPQSYYHGRRVAVTMYCDGAAAGWLCRLPESPRPNRVVVVLPPMVTSGSPPPLETATAFDLLTIGRASGRRAASSDGRLDRDSQGQDLFGFR